MDTFTNSDTAAIELPDNGIDDDCSGADASTCFVDADDDGYGGISTQIDPDGGCLGSGLAVDSGDCAERDPGVHSFALDPPDGGG